LASTQVIACTDARKDAIKNGQGGLPGRNKGPYLAKKRAQRRLAHHRRLARHVWTGNEDQLITPRKADVIGCEFVPPNETLNDRMA
jgi:hypothetical protein